MRETRRDNWDEKLREYISLVYRRPFDDQLKHCGIFAGDAILAQTGEDRLLSGLRDAKNLSEMLERVEDMGYEDTTEFVASRFEEVSVAMALPGDLAVLPGEFGPSYGIIQGDYVYGVGRDGIYMVPRSHVERAFAV